MLKSNAKKITLVVNTTKSSLINVSPRKFSDSKAVSKEILKGNALVVDIQEMPKVEAIRFIDFITGVLFTTGGSFQKIANKTYLLAPSKDVLNKFLPQFEN